MLWFQRAGHLKSLDGQTVPARARDAAACPQSVSPDPDICLGCTVQYNRGGIQEQALIHIKENMKIQANDPWASMLSNPEGDSFYILNIEH